MHTNFSPGMNEDLIIERSMENIAERMKRTDEKMDVLAERVTNIESDIFSEEGETIQVNSLLKSVNEVKENYQSLRKELMEVQDLQKQLSSSLQVQLRMMQSKFNTLKEKVIAGNVSSRGLSRSQSISSSHTRQEYIGFENVD
ncbi:uncharacterized protein LOC123320688 [Coccinella septempunctata]|uniref:uncharacterized protein LOC123320688 n=1 Tax=Coccinella septempunctata TaxID=41139 RepID=UPI001D06BA0E|nr:uncharacterized protein LOC123320688 [Coccinella septempunctata]